MATVDFKDNSAKIMQEFKSRKGVALNLIGASATGHTQDNTPVRTGNLVNHADWEVSDDEEYVEFGFKSDPDPEKDPYYANYVEDGSIHNRPNHMVRRAATENTEEYKEITKRTFENA